METINKKYDLKIEVLTPLSIGAGAEKDWVKGVDFVVNKGKLYKLNLRKISKEGVNIDELTPYLATKNECGVINTITEGRLDKVSDLVLTFPVNSTNDINDIKAFVKNQLTGKPILVGSSLKGAIRSILFDYLRENEQEEQQVFGDSVKGDEFMRFIKISDAEFNEVSLVNTKIFNLYKDTAWIGGWKHGTNTDCYFRPFRFNTIYECLLPGQKSSLSLILSLQSFKKIEEHLHYEKKYKVLSGELSVLFGIINEHTKSYLQKELEFFKKYNQAENSQLIIDSIYMLLKQIPKDNSYCILKMSAGSGFHSITGDWQFDDYSNGQFDRKRASREDLENASQVLPKSRKIAVWDNHFDLMGFVKLSELTEEEFKLFQEIRKKELKERSAQLENEMLERAQRIRQEYERIENEIAFNQYRVLAEQADAESRWDDVLELVTKAESLFPERVTFLKHLVDNANANIAIQMLERQKNDVILQDEEKRRVAYNVPLADKIARSNKLPTLFGNTKQWMKYNNKQTLNSDELHVLFDKISEIFNSCKDAEKKKLKTNDKVWKDLVSLLGEDIVSDMINKL